MNTRALVLRTLQRASDVAAAAIGMRMNATVLIERLAEEATLNQTTGVLDYAKVATIYSGPAHVGPRAGGGQMALGGSVAFMSAVRISIPLDAPAPRDQDQVTVTAHLDSAWVGSTFTLTDVEAPGAIPAMRVLHGEGIQPSRRKAP